MLAFTSLATFTVLRLLAVTVTPASLVEAIPASTPSNTDAASSSSSSYWLADIKRQGSVPFGDSNFKVFRNVKDYGAKGDGSTDDTASINQAIADGNRCGKGCDSSTTTPAIIYFPPGTYSVSAPIVSYYYSQLVGDALSLPTIKGLPSFKGMALIDVDPYEDGGANWYTNQNNFYRQIRNFVIDLTAIPPTTASAGIHWQVAQATSLQNIRFEMVKGGTDNKQQGIFMDNGSGGFMTDLVFNGGNYGAFFGSQQFTTRNLTFNGCNTAVFMNWNWLWNLKSLQVNDCNTGVNMSNTPTNQTVGSVIIQDSTFKNVANGVITAFSKQQNVPPTGNTLIIDNCDFTSSSNAVVDYEGVTILKGGSKVASFIQGHGYTTGDNTAASASTATCASSAPTASSTNVQGTMNAPPKPSSLLTQDGTVFERAKPQYETVQSSSFISVKSAGAKGDGSTDDTNAIQQVFNNAKEGQIVYFDHGAYIITQTIKVPKNIKITGEIWPMIMASGNAFQDMSKPTPVFQIGQPGDTGAVEMSDLIFATKGNAPGAILLEWNLAATEPGANGLWDVHFRIGGTAGTDLQSDKCSKNDTSTITPQGVSKCQGAFLLLHVTSKGSVYVENVWAWVADHELDRQDHDQVNIYNGRGVLIESAEGPVWMYGTSSEHSQLYNYQILNAKNVYMGIIQTETPYMSPKPTALNGGFKPNDQYSDPTFEDCNTDACREAWGLRVVGSTDIQVYGAGLYSFFSSYDQTCLATESCQENMVDIQCSSDIVLYGLSTKAATSMVNVDGKSVVPQKDNRSNFCSTIAVFEEV